MNDKRRKVLREIIYSLEDIRQQLEDVQAEEMESYINLSDGLQQSHNGQKISDSADALTAAEESVSDAINSIEEAIEK